MSRPNIYPKYSFVQDSSFSTAAACYPDHPQNLPLSSWGHLACQIQLDMTSPQEVLSGVTGSTSLIYLTPVAPDFVCSYDAETPGSGGEGEPETGGPSLDTNPFPFTHHPVIVDAFAVTDTAPASGYVYVYFDAPADGGDMDLTTTANNTIDIPVGACFKFAIVWDIYSSGELIARYYYGCTNTFIRTAVNECYTSVLNYGNSSDAFDFHYDGPNVIPTNTVELPMYLRDPSMENDLKAYTRSDGSIVKLFERKEEVYQLETDLMPYAWHKALDIALSHDTVNITNPNASAFDPLNTATQFIKKENYEIEYNKAPLSALGKGSCKLSNADPIHLINNNCS